MGGRLRITCPCCKAKLTVDAETGDILAHKKPRRGASRTLEDALARERRRAGQRDAEFEKALSRNRRRDDLLDRKYEEAKKRAEEDPDAPPPNPLDFD